MSDNIAIVYVHGYPARDWEQVVEHLNGDAHAQSKVQVMVDGKFFDLRLGADYLRVLRA